ncbi:DUF1963 domain-containing protein [Corynebacterium efficiens]|uniref:DUF1963 domain-containing protein n=1 Tax=Corynebacterium efficiens TaxID=152794 RepID=UPI0039C6710D
MSDSSVQVGGSRLGGLPDLPRGQDWFLNSSTGAPLNFVAQINLAEVAAVTDSPLPARFPPAKCCSSSMTPRPSGGVSSQRTVTGSGCSSSTGRWRN